MPQIKTYNQQVTEPGPVQSRQRTGADYSGNMGNNIAALAGVVGDTAGTMYKIQERDEQTNVKVKMAEATERYAREIAERTKSYDPAKDIDTKPGGSPGFADEITSKYDKEMEKLGEGIETAGAKDYLKLSGSTLRNSIYRAGAAAQLEMSTAKTKAAYTTSMNHFQNTLMLDPSSIDSVMQQHDDQIQTYIAASANPEAAETLRARGRSELVGATIRGAIDRSPLDARLLLDSGKFDEFISSDQKMGMYREIKQQESLNESDKKRKLRLEKDEREKKVEAAAVKTIDGIIEGNITFKDIKNNPDLDASHKKTYYSMLEKDATAAVTKDDPDVVRNIWDRIQLPDGDPNKIVSAEQLSPYYARGLGKDTYKFLRDQVDGSKTPQGKHEALLMKTLRANAKAELTNADPLLGVKDPQGNQNFLAWVNVMQSDINKGKKEGKSVANMLNPAHADYIGGSIKAFKRTPQENLKASLEQLKQDRKVIPAAQGVAPRMDGESIDDYLVRIKK